MFTLFLPILGLCCFPGVASGLCSLYFRFMLDHLGTMLGCVGSSWAYVGPSAFLGSMLGHLGSVLAYLGAMLRRLGTMQNEERTSKCKSCMKTCFQGSFSRYLRCFLHIARFRSASLKTTKRTKCGSRAGKTHFLQQLDSL